MSSPTTTSSTFERNGELDSGQTKPYSNRRIGWIEIIGAAVLLLNFMISAASFVVVWHYQTPTFLASEHLSSIDGALKSIELTVAETKNQLALRQSQVTLTLDVLKMIQSISPNFEIIGNPTSRMEDGKHELITFQIRNNGEYAIFSENTEAYLSATTTIDENDYSGEKNRLKYQITAMDKLGYLSPKSLRLQSLHVYWAEGRPKTVNYFMKIGASTDDVIVTVLKQMTNNLFNPMIDKTKDGWVSVNGSITLKH